MIQKQSHIFSFKNIFLNDKFILCSIILSFIYWIYLFFTSTMFINSDAMNYYNLGKMIHTQGWKEYFITGPNREPIFPFLISVSMKIAEGTPLPYTKIQTIFQIGLLFTTQLIMIHLLNFLKISKKFITAIILYIGLSPAIVNSTFSLFSEIATYPVMLLIPLISALLWKQILTDKKRKIFAYSIFLGLLFILICFMKGIFEAIIPLLLLPFFFLLIRSIIYKNKTLAINTTSALLISITLFSSAVFCYKYANKIHNGNFSFTNRGTWALYGNTVRRMQDMTLKRYLAALAYAPGEGICKSLFGPEECLFWAAHTSDTYGIKKQQFFRDIEIPELKINSYLMADTKKAVLKNPFKYLFFMGIEASKMLFWESTRIGWVIYPDTLQKIFDIKILNNTLRLLTALASLWAIVFLTRYLWKNKTHIFQIKSENSTQNLFLFFTLLLITTYTAVHSLFYILSRYVFPVVPLYLILFAFSMHHIYKPKTKK